VKTDKEGEDQMQFVTTNQNDFDNEATIPLDYFAPVDNINTTDTNKIKNNNKSNITNSHNKSKDNEDSSDDTEQVLITKNEWKEAQKRIAKLEEIVAQLQNNASKKRKYQSDDD